MWKIDLFILSAITIFLFYKNASLFLKQRYEMLRNGNWQNKCRIGILEAKFEWLVGGGGQNSVLGGASPLKKIEWVLILLIFRVFFKKQFCGVGGGTHYMAPPLHVMCFFFFPVFNKVFHSEKKNYSIIYL